MACTGTPLPLLIEFKLCLLDISLDVTPVLWYLRHICNRSLKVQVTILTQCVGVFTIQFMRHYTCLASVIRELP